MNTISMNLASGNFHSSNSLTGQSNSILLLSLLLYSLRGFHSALSPRFKNQLFTIPDFNERRYSDLYKKWYSRSGLL
ncbi:hypothetical protein SAMN05216311_103411 [Chitinophaga sp. CF418]|nr:hypothetical protein SAMN05216311_103411 [Chitinophaga sp. CF418]